MIALQPSVPNLILSANFFLFNSLQIYGTLKGSGSTFVHFYLVKED
jgi:hypothetical protein